MMCIHICWLTKTYLLPTIIYHCQTTLPLKVVKLDKGRVYTSGCLKELTKCINWRRPLSFSQDENDSPYDDIYSPLTSPTIMYVTHISNNILSRFKISELILALHNSTHLGMWVIHFLQIWSTRNVSFIKLLLDRDCLCVICCLSCYISVLYINVYPTVLSAANFTVQFQVSSDGRRLLSRQK